MLSMLPGISDTGPVTAIIIRTIAPVLILRWPLGGMLVSILADYLDVVIVAVMQSGTWSHYTPIDKLLDIYMLGFAVSVSLYWTNTLARRASVILFALRLMGVLVLVLTESRWVLFAFPNVFELFYLFHLSTLKWFEKIEIDSCRRLATVVALITLLKMFHEYVLHVGGFHPLSYVWGAVIVTVICCLPTGAISIAYVALHRARIESGRASDAEQLVAKAKTWGWATAAMGSVSVIIWVGLAGLNLTVDYGRVFAVFSTL